MALQTFGKRIVLKVFTEGEEDPILDATGLRVDFDIKNTMDYNRGQFSIYNLDPHVVKELSNGNRFVSIDVGLHGGELTSLGRDFYVTNATTEIILPNTITTLYCMSGLRRSFLEQQIHTNFEKKTLKEFIQILSDSVKGSTVNTEFTLFPEGILQYRTPEGKITRYDGSIEEILKRLSKMYHFQYFLQGNTVRFVYRADTPGTYEQSLKEREGKEFTVDVINLRANPIIGVGSIHLDINLSPNIFPGDVFDTDNLITATNDAGFEYLVAVRNDIKSTVTKYTRFQVWEVVQRGSNYTNQWNTIVEAFTAKDGNRMSINQFGLYGRN